MLGWRHASQYPVNMSLQFDMRPSVTKLSGEPLLVPGDVQLDGSMIHWADSKQAPPRRVIAPHDILQQFLKLADAKPLKIEAFARKWGILGICQHALPRTHNVWRASARDSIPLDGDGAPCEPLGMVADMRGYAGTEPIEAWQTWSQCARDTLALADAAHSDRKVSPEVWRRLFGTTPLDRQDARSLKKGTASAVQHWLEFGNVRPQFSWGASPIQIVYSGRDTWEPLPAAVPLRMGGRHGTTLFPELAVRMMMTVTRIDALAVCSSCNNPFIPPGRRPAAGRRRYCETCRKDGAPLRDAKRDSYARLKRGVRRRSTRT